MLVCLIISLKKINNIINEFRLDAYLLHQQKEQEVLKSFQKNGLKIGKLKRSYEATDLKLRRYVVKFKKLIHNFIKKY